MRILQVNKFNYPRGGADKYFLDLTRALKATGHKTAIFAMDDPRNQPSPWKKYFVSRISFDEGKIADQFRAPGRIIYSREAKRKFQCLIDDFKPDLIHCHNIYHQLSPSILEVAKKNEIPVVLHLHDYKLICPNYRLFTKNHICYECLDRESYWPCVKNNCYASSGASLLAYLEMTIHHKILNIYKKNIDLLIAPSNFIRELLIRSGWPEEKMITIYNPAPEIGRLSGARLETDTKDYLLYFGRLATEKGIEDLIKTVRNNSWRLKIAGDGSEEKKLRLLSASEVDSGQIEFLGRLSKEPLEKIMAEARAVVIPSRWPENMPLSLLESLASGKIVVASRVGGIPEIIKDGENGFLFTPGNTKELTAKINRLLKLKKEEIKKIRLRARTSAQALNPNDHLKAILKIYQKLAKKSD
ncbi:MAG: glycosyltransferase family 4 protein [Patescibacteria group bacterium]|jgi:glycosyltransferase involved in cell wall biosynthesis